MITEHDLQEAIAECEGQRNPSASTCMKLAAFYTIQDKMYPHPAKTSAAPLAPAAPEPTFYSRAVGPVEDTSDSEFGRAIAGMDMEVLIPIMDELMSTLKVISPRLYAGVMRKLSDL